MRIRLSLLVVCAIGISVTAGAAQTADDAAPGEVAVDPIRCWWRTDRSAVHIGERFLLTLTCRVVETSSISVVPSLTQLEPGAVLLTPFESVGGRRHDDVVAPPYRYLQFEYIVRFLGEGAFGTDIAIPALSLTYNVEAAGSGAQGRDQRYVLPPIPMRVVSLAPRDAADIRDAAPETFAAIEARRFRSTAALVGAWLFFGLGIVLTGVAGLRAMSGRRVKRAATARAVPVPAVLQGCLRTLRGVKAEAARAGWSPALARRAVTALRIAGASAMGRAVAQAPANGHRAAAPDGQILLRGGLIRSRPVLVSAPTTPDTLSRHLGNGVGNGRAPSPRQRAAIEPIEAALRTFSVNAYGRGDTHDTAALDAALETGTKAVRRLQVQSLWTRAPRPAGRAEGGSRPGQLRTGL